MAQQEEDKKLESVDPKTADGLQTPLDELSRKTGQSGRQDVRPGAEPEAPGHKKDSVPGNPNQGTEAR
jgi:hypothetical protein